MQNKKSAVQEALDGYQKIRKGSLLAKQPGSTSTRPKDEWEISLEQVKTSIGHNTFSWLKQNEPICINLLTCSQSLTRTIKLSPLAKVLTFLDRYKEYSFMITPAAKAYEGFLFRLMIHSGETTEKELEGKYLGIGYFYKDHGKQMARAKKHVIRGRDKSVVNKLMGDWEVFRNKAVHFDEDFLVLDPDEARKIVNNIYGSIKLAYKIFIGIP